METKTFTLCSGGGCCPTISFDENRVHIRDDLGGAVTLTYEEFRELVVVSAQAFEVK